MPWENMDLSRIAGNFFFALFTSLAGVTIIGAGWDGILLALWTAVIVGGVAATAEWKKEAENLTPPKVASSILLF